MTTIPDQNDLWEELGLPRIVGKRASGPLFVFTLVLTVVFAALILALQFWRYLLVDRLPLFEPLLEIVVSALFALSLLWSVIYLFIARRNNEKRYFVPVLVNAAALILVFVFPFQTMMLHVNFSSNMEERTLIVEMVSRGELSGKGIDGMIELPDDWKYLSRGGGEIQVERTEGKTAILFYTYRGFDGLAGFVYSPNGIPEKGDFGTRRIGDWKAFRNDWYWIRGR